jgi:hypothetical protein
MADHIVTTKPAHIRAPNDDSPRARGDGKIPAQADTFHSIRHLNQIELSRRWSLSPRTLERWRCLGLGPRYLKIVGRVVYRLDDVEAFEAQQTAGLNAVGLPPSSGHQQSPRRESQTLPPGKTGALDRYLVGNGLIAPAAFGQIAIAGSSRPEGHLWPHKKGLPMTHCAARAISVAIAKHATPYDENGFVDWIVDAQASDCIAYYRGHLGLDRCAVAAVLCPGECRRLIAVSRCVMLAADQGLVFPVQRRLGPHDHIYLAVRAFGRLGSPLQQMQAPALAA